MSDNSSAEQSLQICPYYIKGCCNRGATCKFSHPIIQHFENSENNSDDTVNQEPSIRELVTSSVSFASKKISTTQNNAKLNIPCKHFFETGWCKFGKHCRYSHKRASNGDNGANHQRKHNQCDAKPSTEIIPENVEHRSNDKVKQESTRWNEQRRPICKFYLAGYCKQGARCRYFHVRPSPSHTAGKKQDVSNSEQTENAAVNTDTKCQNEALAAQPASDHVNKQRVVVGKPVVQFKSADEARNYEMDIVKKRYPNCSFVEGAEKSSECTFIFTPSDPDWPYDVKDLSMTLIFPQIYPNEMLQIVINENELMPESVRRSIESSIRHWVRERYDTYTSSRSSNVDHFYESDLVFRTLMKWLDVNAERIFTDALREYKQEMILQSAGLQLIPATRLRETHYIAKEDERYAEDINRQEFTSLHSTNDGIFSDGENKENIKTSMDDEHGILQVNSGDDVKESSMSNLQPVRRGTEVTLQNLELGEGIATLRLSRLTLVVACSRCNRTCELVTPVGRLSSLSCAYCRSTMLVRFNPSLCHQMSNIVGYLDLDRCSAFDLPLVGSTIYAGCLNCDKENRMEGLTLGQKTTSWCTHCHQKLTVSLSNIRFVNITPTGNIQLDFTRSTALEVAKPIKTVRDPLIQEGKPLPALGACRHYKKSYRWFRFPCCGKAYPCDVCHEENETHELKFANRMICGHCCKEQAYSPEGVCIGCKSFTTKKSTDHWEGGRGCRDKIRMSRNDNKKFSNMAKTVSKSVEMKKQETKKATKLRHAV